MTRFSGKKNIGDKLLFLFLTIIILIISISVTVEMLKPSERKVIVNDLLQDGLAIISASQAWVVDPDRNPESGSTSPFNMLRFDQIGYFEGVSPDGRTMANQKASYVLLISDDGGRFSLEITGSDRIKLTWQGITPTSYPEPKIN